VPYQGTASLTPSQAQTCEALGKTLGLLARAAPQRRKGRAMLGLPRRIYSWIPNRLIQVKNRDRLRGNDKQDEQLHCCTRFQLTQVTNTWSSRDSGTKQTQKITQWRSRASLERSSNDRMPDFLLFWRKIDDSRRAPGTSELRSSRLDFDTLGPIPSRDCFLQVLGIRYSCHFNHSQLLLLLQTTRVPMFVYC